MAACAFVLGGTGQIGTEVAKLLALSGWTVTSFDRGSRAPASELAELGVQRRVGDRHLAGELEAALGAGADVLVDTVAFDAGDALQVAGLAGVVGSVVAISSASVYAIFEAAPLTRQRGRKIFRFCPFRSPRAIPPSLLALPRTPRAR